MATGLVVLAAAIVAGGCETNAQRSAKLEKERLAHRVVAQKGLTVARVNPDVRILETAIVHDENGTAAVVTLRDNSAQSAERRADRDHRGRRCRRSALPEQCAGP